MNRDETITLWKKCEEHVLLPLPKDKPPRQLTKPPGLFGTHGQRSVWQRGNILKKQAAGKLRRSLNTLIHTVKGNLVKMQTPRIGLEKRAVISPSWYFMRQVRKSKEQKKIAHKHIRKILMTFAGLFTHSRISKALYSHRSVTSGDRNFWSR